MRTTSADLERLATKINAEATRQGKDWRIGVFWAYDQPRVELADQTESLSPRLRIGLLYDWLSAFLMGLRMGRE